MLCTRSAVDEPFSVLFANDLMVGETPATKQQVDVHTQTLDSALAV